MGTIPSVSDVVDAVVYLTEARNITGEPYEPAAGPALEYSFFA